MKIVYIHFSDQRLMPEGMVEEKHIALSHRFEAFTMTVYNLLVHSRRNVFYIFDSLSDLQTAWATDLMMQNFFMVITPLISDRGCRAFYPLIRSRHSAKAIDGILEEADAVLDVYSDFKDLYVRAMKLPGITRMEACILRSTPMQRPATSAFEKLLGTSERYGMP